MPRMIDKFERTRSLSSKFNDGLVVPREGSWAVSKHDVSHALHRENQARKGNPDCGRTSIRKFTILIENSQS